LGKYPEGIDKQQDETFEHIPCVFIPYDGPSTKLVIYFHGNAEDIGQAYDMLA